ncbi:alanine dehydrogenase [Vibrio kanaloae]|uniref:Alanine dehydrogenase n=1 Tax=Vibrio kanaloae TaxID=170673 RepID=A0A4U1YYJ7_9VIBR|nr:alanine dehydrogenase [Vibrio kanaloae]TKF25919.1 alanine dehydrogenase [Vibrio kanaloae]
MKVAVFGTSLKKHEKRIPIHPEHFPLIPESVLKTLYFEEDYASGFGFDINSMIKSIGGILPRKDLFKVCDTLILPKFSDADNLNFQEGQTIYGWPHCVQGEKITQVAIDKKLTLVAFEAMFSGNGSHKHHIFHKNNEIAGFASVQHGTQLRGVTGYYGGKLKAIVFGFGSTSRGAIHALKSQGISDITVYTRRQPHLVEQQIPGIKYKRYIVKEGVAYCQEHDLSMAKILVDSDVIVNCVMQDPNDPILFVRGEDKYFLKDNAIIIDVSCDELMGFDFARPTTFDKPGFIVSGTQIYYYAVDHSPTLYWNTSSNELSLSLLPYLKYITSDNGYRDEDVLLRALEIESGIVINKSILEFQNRTFEYPYTNISN